MKLNKTDKYVLIVESPNKVATIKQIFRDAGYNNITVLASVGHISYIKDSGDYNMGIDPKNYFKADYAISADKKEIVTKLKDNIKAAKHVILGTDGDREGEAIAWHLKTLLKIPESKYDRIVYHEITKQAIFKAIEESRKIDLDLVASATTRQKLDKIVGYRLSGIARKNVNAKSVGRCQSAGLKIIVQREEEINNFKPETYFDVYVEFEKNKTKFKAKYCGTDKDKIDHLKSLDEVKQLEKECSNNEYIIKNVEKKQSFDNPKPAFTTSTFQQEVSKKLGISIKTAMDYAQKLFEGIYIDGKHIALTTYLRTDDPNIDPTFIPQLKTFIEKHYGNNYYSEPKKIKTGETSQEGHECFRVIDLNMTPEDLSKHITDDKLLKVYTIIYKRTLAAAFKPAIMSNTIYSIYNKDNKFMMTSREMIFDGYKKVYDYKDEKSDDDELIRETFTKGEQLINTVLSNVKKETKPAPRYTEASFIKELDKQSIGRPSTFSNIVSVLLDPGRNYCKVEDKAIVPTDLGVDLSHFLDKSFGDIINVSYTRELEKDLDLIAKGKADSIDFLTDFYKKLEENINKVIGTNSQETMTCPDCGSKMYIRKGPYGTFWGCSNYPKCKKIIPINNKK